LSVPSGFEVINCTDQTPTRASPRIQMSSSGIHALLFFSDQVGPALDTVPLLTCTVKISPHLPPGPYPLIVGGLLVTDGGGDCLNTNAPDGEILVLARPTPEASHDAGAP